MRSIRFAGALTLALLVGVLGAGKKLAAQQPGMNPSGQAPAMGQMEHMDHPAPASANTLALSYNGKTEQFTAATLAPLPHKAITVFNEHAKVNQTYSGVPLIDLLLRLGVPDKPHGKDFRLYLVAEGADGYEVVYSFGEVSPDVHDGTVLVADALEGKPMPNSGPLQLVTTGEKRPARWVRNLVSIRVLTAE